MATWKIIDRGNVPLGARTYPMACPGCHKESDLPVTGVAVAGFEGGFVFDSDHEMPKTIQCRNCKRILSKE